MINRIYKYTLDIVDHKEEMLQKRAFSFLQKESFFLFLNIGRGCFERSVTPFFQKEVLTEDIFFNYIIEGAFRKGRLLFQEIIL
jgi:hypothetical protein